jgi:Fic family protein
MASFPKSLKDYINVAALRAYTKTVEAEYFMLKELHEHLGLDKPGSKSKRRRGPRGKIKAAVLAFLHKNRKGKAKEIAELSGLKVASVHQTLFHLKKGGHVKQDKKRGSPFVLVKK